MAEVDKETALRLYSRDENIKTIPLQSDIASLRKLIAVFHTTQNVYVVMDPLEEAQQLGMFFRPEAGSWAIAHALSMPMTDYVEALLERGPVNGQRAQLRRIEMQNGTHFLLRSFYIEETGQEEIVPMYEKPPGGRPIALYVPEDRFRHFGEPFQDWLAVQKERFRCELKEKGDTSILNAGDNWRDLVPQNALYFTINKSDVYDPHGNKKPNHAISGEYLQMENFESCDGVPMLLPTEQLESRSVLQDIIAQHQQALLVATAPRPGRRSWLTLRGFTS